MAYNVLIVEDTPDWRAKLVGYLVQDEEEYNIFEAGDYETALQILDDQPLDVAVIDIRLVDWDETNEQGMLLLKELDRIADVNGTQAIVITGYGDKQKMRTAFRDYRVIDFIEKHWFKPVEFKETVRKAAEEAYRAREEVIDTKYPR